MENDPLLPDAVPGVVDYQGRPASRSATGRWTSALFIIGVEVAERFAYYGISNNLISFLTGPLQESTAAAAAAINVWNGVASMLPLLGAFIADSFLGRYPTIVMAALLYILGLGLLTLLSSLPSSVCPTTDPAGCSPSPGMVTFFYASLYLMAFAQGGHKPCVQAFGADQFDENDPHECIARRSFFNWWYMGMISGVLVATVVLSYIQDYIGWGLGFGIPCAAMGIALVLFLLGTKTYRFHPTGKKKENILIEKESQVFQSTKGSAGGRGEDIKGLLRLFPIWATCLTYAIVFAQPSTLFNKQARTLDRKIGCCLEVPPAALSMFACIAIMSFVAIYDRIIVPVARKFTGLPSGITMLQRIGTGMVISLLAISIAALVEMKRLKVARDHGLVDQPSATVPMSVWWLVPQYVVVGASDVFTMIGLQEFFYDQVPDSLRSLGLALYLSIFGIGSLISGFLVSMIDKASSKSGESWFSNNLNQAHLDYFYWLLAGISALGLVIYLHFSLAYVPKKDRVATVTV